MWFFDVIKSLDWLEIIKALASVAMVIIAFLALKNWKLQDKAKREIEFLDELIETAHSYISAIQAPITLLQFSKIGMESYATTGKDSKQVDVEIEGAIKYIEKNRGLDAKHLSEELNAARPSLSRLQSLAAKGQVFKLIDYEKCSGAITRLAQHFDGIEAFRVVIGMSALNWENSDVRQCLENVMGFAPDKIRDLIREDNITLLEFYRQTYQRIYG